MITIIDAVMGTGKSTYMIKRLNSKLNQKFIILVPFHPEVTRYKEEISKDFSGKRDDVVALEKEKPKRKSMTERFTEAVRDSKTIVTTHELFSLLSKDDLEAFRNIGDYTLIIDETIVLVDKKQVQDVDLRALVVDEYVEVVEHPEIEDLNYYRLLPKGVNYVGERGQALRKTISAVSGRHVYQVNNRNVVFVVPPEKLSAFREVYIMTYLFDGSETNAWLDLFNLDYHPQELLRDKPDGYYTRNHPLTYSGVEFKSLLHVYDDDINKIGTKKPRMKGRPLTKTWYDKKSASHKDIKQVRNNTRTFFRNMGKEKDKGDTLWTCYKGHRKKGWFKDCRFDPLRGPVETWLACNKRATNDYADRHYMAYLIDINQYPEINRFFDSHGVHYSEDNHSLSVLLQWVWRSAIRNGEEVTLYLPSERMRNLLSAWLK